jgi:2-C-methyl-D-erythritol 4-phosphate cytidylyltransferase
MVSAIVVAAGEGKRIGGKTPKPYIALHEKPIIAWTLEVLTEVPEISSIVVVTHAKWIDHCRSEIIQKMGFRKVSSVVEGGEERQDSVRLGLARANGDFVVIHDAVRPFITPEFVTGLIATVRKYGAVVPGIPVIDTVKEIENGFVRETLNREELREIQTPQVFKLSTIREAHAEAHRSSFHSTDDSALVEKLGVKVKVVDGLQGNMKITTKEDLARAEQLMEKLRSPGKSKSKNESGK